MLVENCIDSYTDCVVAGMVKVYTDDGVERFSLHFSKSVAINEIPIAFHFNAVWLKR